MKRGSIKDARRTARVESLNLPRLEETQDRLVVVLVSTRNPLNIGAAARAMSNFGFRHLRVVNPYSPAFREAKSAVGASALLKRTQEYETLPEAIADCSLVVGTTAGRGRRPDHELKDLPLAAGAIRRQLRSGRVALLFGSEKRGLSNQDLSRCHWLMRIPTSQQHPSMNLGQAVAVCLFAMSQNPNSQIARTYHADASSEELERVTASLVDVLQICGYLESPLNSRAEQKLQRFVRRLSLTQEDARLLLGMIHQMKWKMTKPPQ